MERKQTIWRNIKMWYRKYLRRSLIDYKWVILFSFSGVAFLLGCIGFWKAYAGQNYSGLDIIVLSLRLFLWQTASLVQNPSLSLQIARFLAPALTLTTVAFIVLVSLYEHLALVWIRLFKKCHIVICGLGYIGPVISEVLLDRGYSVVVIESNPTHPEIELAQDRGAFTITGDATKEEVLYKACVDKARYLFAVTGDDARNIDIFNKASAMFSNRKYPLPFTCYTHIEDKELLHILGSGELGPFCPYPLNNTASPSNYCEDRYFFNIYWIASSCILKKYSFIPEETLKALQFQKTNPDSQDVSGEVPPPQIHILIAGVGTFGEYLILQAIFEWWLWFGHTKEQIRITIIDRDPEKKHQLIKDLYPSLYQYCIMDSIEMEIPSPKFLEGTELIECHKKHPFNHIYLCFNDDSLSLKTAIHFQQLLVDVDTHITFRTVHSEQFNSLFDQLKNFNPIFTRITSFPIVHKKCCIDNILCQNIDEKLAMSIHYEYLEQQKREGVTPETNASCVPWYDLHPLLRDSNRNQAAKLKGYVIDTGHKIVPLTEWDTPLFKFSDSEIETLAKREHDRWVEEKKSKGFVFGDKKDLERKTHPCLVDWNELENNEKEKDRNAIRVIPRLFAGIGLRII